MIKGKTINGLMRILRDKHKVSIRGSKHKRQLLNMGYFHGYKGYRFIGSADNYIPYNNFDEVVAIYQFDSNIKSLFYSPLMFIETALKNYTLNSIIQYSSADFDDVFHHLLNDYKKHPPGSKKYKKKMKSRLELRNDIHAKVSYNFNNDTPLIQHYFHKNEPIPLWSIFEVITLGTFGAFVHCLNTNARISIAQDLDIHSTAQNQNGRILEDIIFIIKDLRNAVAHNAVVFDCRYKKSNTSSRLKEFIQNETSIQNVTFDNIVDYLIILIYLQKKLGIQKTELKRIVRRFQYESEQLRTQIPISIHNSIMGSDLRRKLKGLKNFI